MDAETTTLTVAPTTLTAPTRPTTDAPTIEAEGVSKWYGDKVAVSDLSFALRPGVTALLGPNGAGKSTTLKMLTGLLRPSRGRVRVLGQRADDNPALYRRIGLVPEQEGLYPFLTGREFVELAARLNRLPRPREVAERALSMVEMQGAAGRKLGGYSKACANGSRSPRRWSTTPRCCSSTSR